MAIIEPKIKRIELADGEHEINAKYLQDSLGNAKSWEDISSLITTGFTIEVPWLKSDFESTTAPGASKLAEVPAITIYYNNGSSSATGTLPAYDPNTRSHIYLIFRGGGTSGADYYDEYVATGSMGEWVDGHLVPPTVDTSFWERIGSTDIDLSDYPTKYQAAKPGTYATSGPNTDATGSAGAATITTSSSESQTATGTATITYVSAPTVTGEAGAGTANTNTGEAGGVTINGSNFTFTGTTATLSQEAGKGSIQIDNHEFTPQGTLGGSQTFNAHTHTVNVATSTKTVVVSVDEATGSAGDHSHTVDSHTHAASITAITGLSTATVNELASGGSFTLTSNYGFAASQTVLTGATVDSSTGVLSWTSATASTTVGYTYTPATSSSVTVVTGVASTATAAGVESAATLTTSSTGAHTHSIGSSTDSITYVTGATLDSAGAHTVYGSNFTFTGSATVLTHTQVATETADYETLETNVPAVSITYTPQGSISGSQVVAAHSHTYTAPTAHTHSITGTTTTITVPLEVAISGHTHTVTIADHTHSLSNHTHSVTIPAIATPTV